MTQGFVPDRANKVTTLALFVENRTRVTDSLALVSGMRRDQIDLEVTNLRTATATDPAYFKNTYKPVTGRLGAIYDISPGANVYAQYSTAADPPAGILSTASFSQVRDFDLTTGRQVEVGSKFDYWAGRGSATLAARTKPSAGVPVSRGAAKTRGRQRPGGWHWLRAVSPRRHGL